jgi:hypothetical protein
MENTPRVKNIYIIKLELWLLREAIKAIGGLVPRVIKYEPEPVHWQRLVLFALEADRVNYVFGKTSDSLCFSHGVPIVIHIPRY